MYLIYLRFMSLFEDELRCERSSSIFRKDAWDSGFAQTQSYVQADLGRPGLLQPKHPV